MDEQEKITGETKTDTTADTGEGIQQQTITELDRADQIAERQKRENDRREKLIEREEAMQARRMVGGVAEAGQVVEKKEQTPQEYVDKIRKDGWRTDG